VFVGFFAAGALTMRLFQRPDSLQAPVESNGSVMAAPEPPVATASDRSPLAIEWQAIDNSGTRAELFRQAGDGYLTEFGDVESALRCYRNALAFGSAADAAIRPDDSWLMISLKRAKYKEKHDAPLDG
jgi:hypothetical protein